MTGFELYNIKIIAEHLSYSLTAFISIRSVFTEFRNCDSDFLSSSGHGIIFAHFTGSIIFSRKCMES